MPPVILNAGRDMPNRWKIIFPRMENKQIIKKVIIKDLAAILVCSDLSFSPDKAVNTAALAIGFIIAKKLKKTEINCVYKSFIILFFSELRLQ